MSFKQAQITITIRDEGKDVKLGQVKGLQNKLTDVVKESGVAARVEVREVDGHIDNLDKRFFSVNVIGNLMQEYFNAYPDRGVWDWFDKLKGDHAFDRQT